MLITVCLEDFIWHFSETWVIRSSNLLCIIYYLDSRDILKRCHSNSYRKPCSLSWCKGRKQRSFLWAEGSGSLCYLSCNCLGHIYKGPVPRCQGVSVEIRSCSRSRQSQQGDTARQIGREGEEWSQAPSPAALPELTFYPWQGSTPCPGTFQVPHVWFLSRSCKEDFFILAFSDHIGLHE